MFPVIVSLDKQGLYDFGIIFAERERERERERLEAKQELILQQVHMLYRAFVCVLLKYFQKAVMLFFHNVVAFLFLKKI